MKRYPKYKDSGIDWLGEIPEHWEKLKGKYLFKRMNRPVREYDEVVTAFRDGTVTLRSNRRLEGFTNSLKEIGYQGVRKGDLIIHAMDAFAGAIGVSDSDGKSTPVYAACQPISDANPYYYCYLIRRMSQSGYILALAKGIRERSTEFRYSEFANQEFPVPPLEEQKTIACFIDRKLVQIDQFIRNKQRFIELLKEQKSAIVNRAVTKGLNPDAPMKPSGIEWLGDIPEGWEVNKLGYLVNMKGGGTPSKDKSEFWNGDIPWVSPKDMKVREISDSLLHISPLALSETSLQLINPPVVLLVVRGMILARTVPVCLTTTPVTINQDMKAFEVKKGLSAKFLVYLLEGIGHNLSIFVEDASHGTKCLRTDNLKKLHIPIPTQEEQKHICIFVDEEFAKIDQAIAKAKQEIELIQEYRTTLISDAVTGKIDVRELTHNS